MGMDLRGAGGEFHFNIGSWRNVLALAEQYGWKPRGTQSPRIRRLRTDISDDQYMAYVDWFRDAIARGERGEPPLTSDPLPPDVWNEDVMPQWDGGYFSNEYQWVAEHDAAELADALERALAKLVNLPGGGSTLPHLPRLEERLTPAGVVVNDDDPLDWYSGAGKQRLRSFIAYCRAGGFAIG
jgi:hypothetical protein